MLIVFLLLSSLFLNPNSVLAVSTPTPTPTAVVEEETASPTEAPSDNLEEIKKIRMAVQEKVKEKLKEITTTSAVGSKKAIIGTIKEIGAQEIILESKSSIKKVTTTADTVFIDLKRNKTKFENLKVGQEILVLGYQKDDTTLEAKRFILIELKTIIDSREIVTGKIVDISKSSPVFALIPVKNKNIQYQIKTDTKTVVVTKNGSKSDLKNLGSGQKIIVILEPDLKTANTFYASKIVTEDNSANLTPTPAKAAN